MVDFEYPFDELAERAVLGAMIKDPENIPVVLEHLREEDFYYEQHRLLFSVLYKVWDFSAFGFQKIASFFLDLTQTKVRSGMLSTTPR